MADYKAIKGLHIQIVSSDPSNITAGDVWYNSTLGKIRGAQAAAGAWATGGNMSRGGGGNAGGGGIQTAAIIAGGYRLSPSANVAIAETYDGSSWTEVADLNLARNYVSGAGLAPQTAALVFGGGGPYKDETESWDGSSWTEVADLNKAKNSATGAGTQTAALMLGGYAPGGPGMLAEVEFWNGTSWTETTDFNTARYHLGGCGTQTSAIVWAGGTTDMTAVVEQWNGTSWTEVADINNLRYQPGPTGAGESGTSALAIGGANVNVSPRAKAHTEQWDGTSWTEIADLGTARYAKSDCGTTSLALTVGGYSHTAYTATAEEWSGAPIQAANWDTT